MPLDKNQEKKPAPKPVIRKFRYGGIELPDRKFTSGSFVEKTHIPKKVRIPLSQHQGNPAKLLVRTGDIVEEGKPIGEGDGEMSANVHASVPGKVVAIEKARGLKTDETVFVIIETGGNFRNWYSTKRDPASMGPAQMLSEVRKAGIIGLGGAAYPTHLKLAVNPDKPVRLLVVNGAECEPYLTSDHRLMLEKADEILSGIRIAMKMLGAGKAVIGIGENKMDAVDAFKAKLGEDPAIGVEVLGARYPQGGEKMIVETLTGREIPSGGYPADIGAAVMNVSTIHAVYEAVVFGKPLIERVITYSGETVTKRGNYKVRIGTTLGEFFEEYGLPEKHGAIIAGGPFTGVEVTDMETPVTRDVSAITVLPKGRDYAVKNRPCIRCSLCLSVCPMKLQPTELAKCCDLDLLDEAVEELGLMDCIECGACSYVCPSVIPIAGLIRYGKEIWKNKNREKTITG